MPSENASHMDKARKFGIIIFTLFSMRVILPAPCLFAYDARLSWTPSVSFNVKGYRVYWGDARRSYTNSADAGNATEYVITGLEDGRPCFFTVTAYGSSREESIYSNEIERAADGSMTSTPSPAPVAAKYELATGTPDLQGIDMPRLIQAPTAMHNQPGMVFLTVLLSSPKAPLLPLSL